MRGGVLGRACVCLVLLVGAAPCLHAAAPYPLLGQSAPDFALRPVAGDNMRLSEHRGEVVALTFWSSRCGPCGSQLAALHRSLQTYGAAGLRVFGINVDDDQARAVKFAGSQSLAFPLLLDPDKHVSRLYQVDSLPMTLLIDRSGAVRHIHRDYSDASQALYLQHLRALLNE